VSLLLRAITNPPTAEPDARLVRVEVGPLFAWATRLAAPPPPFSRGDVLAHHTLVDGVFACVEACLPARFPTVLADEAALHGKLAAQGADLQRQLEVVRGACELAVTATWTTSEDDATEVDATTPGRRYLLQRQRAIAGSERRRARARELAERLENLVGLELRDSASQVCPLPGVALSLALLVNRTAADAVRDRLGRDSQPDVRILVHGPWPPYTFAGTGSTWSRET
jgi:gas vesicle protein GvpL/GvpF